MKVAFPQTRDQPLSLGQKPAKFELNGFYDKEAVALNGGFKAPKSSYLQPVDDRIYNPSENFNQDHKNKIYRANHQLLQEIERSRQERQMERSRRQLDPMAEMQQVEEISPSGVKRQVFNAAAGMPDEGQEEGSGASPERMIDPNRVEMIE